jgi:hypothetical protein
LRCLPGSGAFDFDFDFHAGKPSKEKLIPSFLFHPCHSFKEMVVTVKCYETVILTSSFCFRLGLAGVEIRPFCIYPEIAHMPTTQTGVTVKATKSYAPSRKVADEHRRRPRSHHPKSEPLWKKQKWMSVKYLATMIADGLLREVHFVYKKQFNPRFSWFLFTRSHDGTYDDHTEAQISIIKNFFRI